MTTIYEFELPKGYVDANGTLHKRGKMRLATAGDEISAARDPRVVSNPAYLAIVVLSKVIVEIAGVDIISTPLLEQFYTADLTYLQDMYQRINDVEVPVMQCICPECGHSFEAPINFIREE